MTILAPHYIHKINWLRAAVLGANDGILSTASIAVGVAAASDTREPIVLAALAGLVAGALSMAAGEYVSVSSQTDIEKADIEREKMELNEMPELELQRMAEIYEKRGLTKESAMEVAVQLTAHDALGAHVRDELGLNEVSQATSLASSFCIGCIFYFWSYVSVISCYFPTCGFYGYLSIYHCYHLFGDFRGISC